MKYGAIFLSMQYTITINQKAVMDFGLNLDITDMAIFDYIQHYANCDKCKKLYTEGSVYFSVSHKTIIQQLPMLGIGTGAGILKRINKLIDAGLLERHKDCEFMKMSFYKFGENYEKVYFTPNESLQPPTKVSDTPNDCLGMTPNESLGYHNTIDNHNNYNHRDIRAKGTSENLCLFADSKFYDYEKFAEQFKGDDYRGIDIAYYYGKIADWSSSKGAKKKDWIATARNFMRGDKEKNILKKDNTIIGGALSQDALNYLREMAE